MTVVLKGVISVKDAAERVTPCGPSDAPPAGNVTVLSADVSVNAINVTFPTFIWFDALSVAPSRLRVYVPAVAGVNRCMPFIIAVPVVLCSPNWLTTEFSLSDKFIFPENILFDDPDASVTSMEYNPTILTLGWKVVIVRFEPKLVKAVVFITNGPAET